MPDAKWTPQQALDAMLRHAAVHSPYYSKQEWAARMSERGGVALRDVPITPKALVRDQTAQFFCAVVPPSEGEVLTKATSGSTGEPMLIRKTQRQFAIQIAENLRLKRGWGFERHWRIVHTSAPNDDHPNGQIEQKEGPGGRREWTIYSGDTEAALDLLRRTAATHVLSSPSIMLEVLLRSSETSQPLALQLIATVSELMSDGLPELVRRIPGCRLVDMYGTVETGLIAIQCPLCDAYHLADRHMVVEIITEEGQPAEPGEMGRVVVTPLFNLATPLIRYDTGDYAQLAKSAGCPRSPRAISRIIGRERNLFKLPDGRKVVPRIPHQTAQDIGLRQFKFVQTTVRDIELRYIPRDPGLEITQETAQDMVDKYMVPGFRVRCVKVSELPRAPSGKYLMHECLI